MKYRDTKRVLSTSILASILASLLLVILVVFGSHAGGQESQVMSLKTRIPPTATTESLVTQLRHARKQGSCSGLGQAVRCRFSAGSAKCGGPRVSGALTQTARRITEQNLDRIFRKKETQCTP